MVKVKVFETPKDSKRPSVEAPKTDAKAFHEVVDSRRSVRFFSDDEIPQEVIDKCLEVRFWLQTLQTSSLGNSLCCESRKKAKLIEYVWPASCFNGKGVVRVCCSS